MEIPTSTDFFTSFILWVLITEAAIAPTKLFFLNMVKLHLSCSKNLIIMASNDPLHGKTLETILTFLVDHYGWDELASFVNINSFKSNPSIKSSLTFLRKTPWARKKVEELYLKTIEQ